LSTTLQAKLLRLLQEKEFIRVGGNEVIPVDIRIIAACNQEPNENSKQNSMRQDLFYRLSILYIQLPTLADRASDIPLLLEHFLKANDPELAARMFPLPRDVEAVLSGMPFQGNLRELQGIAARFACLCDRNRLHDNNYLKDVLNVCCDPIQGHATCTDAGRQLRLDGSKTLAESMKHAEKIFLRQSIDRCNSSIKCMAQQLGIARTTLWRKLKEHRLD
jgi:DNA-binding NtrC family response regulator